MSTEALSDGRVRFLLDVVAAIRGDVGRDYHPQVKISATDRDDLTAALYRNAWIHARGSQIEGITLGDSAEVKKAVGIP